MRVGSGRLDLGVVGRGTADSGTVGGWLDYSHRLSPTWSLYGRGEAGLRWAPLAPPEGYWQVGAGVRGRF